MTTRNHPVDAEALMALLDGELTPTEAAAATAHLETCSECQQLAGDLRGLSQTLKAADVPPSEAVAMPGTIVSALDDFVAQKEQGRVGAAKFSRERPRFKDLFRKWAPISAVAAFAMLVIAVVMLPHFISPLFDMTFDMKSESLSAGVKDGAHSAAPPATAGSAEDKQYDRMERFARLQKPQALHQNNDSRALLAGNDADETVVASQSKPAGDQSTAHKGGVPEPHFQPTGPMIIRSAALALTTREFDTARAHVETLLQRRQGYIGSLNVAADPGAGRKLTASLRVPASQLADTLTELKTLGRLDSESQNGEDITSQYVDLEARLANSRHSEQRLTDLLANRTGKLSDVLDVENEIERVRGDIESMEAQRKSFRNQVDFATISLTITEDYRAQLQVVPPSTTTRLVNAGVAGYRSLADSFLSVALFCLESGPTLLVWLAILFIPARIAWKKLRAA
jgi:hypothetical protein